MSTRVTAIVCPGQGSQHAGMLDSLPDRATVERLLDAAEALTDIELRAVERLGDASELSDTRVAQPLLYLADWAWGRALLDAGVEPVALAGHSLGELAALALAEVFSVEAGLQLVAERSSLMATATAASSASGAMAAVLGLSPAAVADAIADIDDLWLANDNCPGQLVVSGTESAITSAESVLLEAGARRFVPLAVSGAFHTPLMADAASAFAQTLEDAEFGDARFPVIQNTRPDTPVTDAAAIREALAEQMTAPVRWTETMTTLRALGVEVLVEAGPGKVLSGLARRVDGLDAVSAENAGIDSILQEVGS